VPIASILTLRHKKSMVYKYGCSDTAFNNMGGMVFLLWKTIQEAKAMGLEHLDLGRSDIENEGLITFKRHWGPVETSLSYWSYPHGNGVSLAHGHSLAGRLFSAMPNAALEAAGRLLYKHFA
jgi:CelD/BcsL family acetyltransferase involved in cellulose biosynthesis